MTFKIAFLSLSTFAILASGQDKFGQPLDNVILGGSSRFGSPTGIAGLFSRSRLRNGVDWPELWTRTSTVPDIIPEVPPAPLFVNYPSGVSIRPNDTVTSGLLLQVPELQFDSSDPSALHSLLMMDVDVDNLPGVPSNHFLHYFVANIPGNDIVRGDLVSPYFPSFTFELNSSGTGFKEDSTLTHRYLWLVYKQEERLDLEEEEVGCSAEILFGRFQTLDSILEKNRLGPLVAGNFHRNKYSGAVTKQFVCVATRCIGAPFPTLLPGVNDMPECQSGSATASP